MAEHRANLKLGNREYLKQPHGSRLTRGGLAHFGVRSGDEVDIRIIYFDLEDRRYHQEWFTVRWP